ncbi:MAG: hypothetical protein ACRCST_13560 [Turicibacter sp.]
MTDKFIMGLEDIKDKMQEEALSTNVDIVSQSEKTSKDFFNTILTTLKDGLSIFDRDRLFTMKLQASDFANRIRDEINYGNLDLTNPAILNGYKKKITDGFNEIKIKMSPYDSRESLDYLSTLTMKTIGDLTETSAQQLNKKRLDSTISFLSYENHRHDDYEDVLDSETGATAYHTLVAYLGETKAHQFINEQRLKNLENMTYNSNIPDGLYTQYAKEKVQLDDEQVREQLARRRNLRLQAAKVYSMNIDEIRESSPEVAYEINKFNEIFDFNPQAGLDNALTIYTAKLTSDPSLSTFEKELRLSSVSSYVQLSQNMLDSNPLNYLIARNLASDAGFSTMFPSDKAASRMGLVVKTAFYSPKRDVNIFTQQELDRLKLGDVTMLPFLKNLQEHIRSYNGMFSQDIKRAYNDTINTFTSPIIFGYLNGLNSDLDIERLSGQILKNPALLASNILDHYVDAETHSIRGLITKIDRKKNYYLKRYNADPIFRKVIQNEFSKLYSNGKPPEGVNIKDLVNNAGIKFEKHEWFSDAWTTKPSVNFDLIKINLIVAAHRKPYDFDVSSVDKVVETMLRGDSKYTIGGVLDEFKRNLTHPIPFVAMYAGLKNIGANSYTLIDEVTGNQIVNVYTGKPVEYYAGDKLINGL